MFRFIEEEPILSSKAELMRDLAVLENKYRSVTEINDMQNDIINELLENERISTINEYYNFLVKSLHLMGTLDEEDLARMKEELIKRSKI